MNSRIEIKNNNESVGKHIYKNMFVFVLVLVIVLLFSLACITYYYDPFFHFHGPREKVKYEFNNQAYQNAGIARNFDYNALIVGSSMTEQLFPSEFDKVYGCKTCKVPYSSATTKNIKMVLDQAFKYHNGNIDYVFWGMDPYALANDVDEYHQEIPEYLYNESRFDDLKYLLNKEVLKQIIDNQKNGKKVCYDDIFIRDDEKEYSQRAAADYSVDLTAPEYSADLNYKSIEVDRNVIENVEKNIIPLVLENPDTKFVFFFPPYPIVQWNERSRKVNSTINSFNYVYEKLSEYDNTELHFLQLMEDTSNLYLYKDNYHFNNIIGRMVPYELKSEKFRVTGDNKEELYGEFFDYAVYSDFSIYNGIEYPFQMTTSLEAYLEEICDDRYTRVVLISDYGSELTEEEEDMLRNKGLVSSDYTSGEFLSIIDLNGNINGVNAYKKSNVVDSISFAGENSKAEITIAGIDYVTDSYKLLILVYDNETGRVVDVAGLRDDTRKLVKY